MFVRTNESDRYTHGQFGRHMERYDVSRPFHCLHHIAGQPADRPFLGIRNRHLQRGRVIHEPRDPSFHCERHGCNGLRLWGGPARSIRSGYFGPGLFAARPRRCGLRDCLRAAVMRDVRECRRNVSRNAPLTNGLAGDGEGPRAGLRLPMCVTGSDRSDW